MRAARTSSSCSLLPFLTAEYWKGEEERYQEG